MWGWPCDEQAEGVGSAPIYMRRFRGTSWTPTPVPSRLMKCPKRKALGEEGFFTIHLLINTWCSESVRNK